MVVGLIEESGNGDEDARGIIDGDGLDGQQWRGRLDVRGSSEVKRER